MANIIYTPTVWEGGKTVATAQIMNNIENGIKNVVDLINSGEVGSGDPGVDFEPYTEQEINSIFI